MKKLKKQRKSITLLSCPCRPGKCIHRSEDDMKIIICELNHVKLSRKLLEGV